MRISPALVAGEGASDNPVTKDTDATGTLEEEDIGGNGATSAITIHLERIRSGC